ISVIGRARKQKIVLNKDFVVETMNVDGHTYQYQQVENSFTQPNAVICEKMLNWVVKHSKNNPHDLLELYCGNGNFTLPLSKNFRQVLATEVSKTSVKSANENIALNNIENVKIVRLSSEELTQALNKVREFRRLANINLDDYAFETVFVDPPRAGLDAETLAFVSQFDTIIYISCNPDTLHENIAQLKTHKIENFALFDQFPYTDHIECGVILKKQS
ncbi:MAG TPA: tRNA (uridine(54)-C5)-methyltransferase TrmA, partial [Gammaproteobacteria bacterium]|nr:tRNA (uridine(54)-C5)-methyltransferase TrmA [Gammaproteobacteria bacterium]